jgi:MFS family permease
MLVCGIVLVDTMLYAALVPLLPEFASEYGLSKAGSGLLVAAFAAGALLAAIPSGIAAAHLGPKRTVLAGLVLMSVACLGFGFAGSAWTLGVSRLFQGFGSTLSWAGGFTWLVSVTPRERRGQTLGTAIGAAVFGAIFGPVLGGAAAVIGTRPTFIAVSVVGAILVGWTLTSPDAEPEPQPLSALGKALQRPSFLGGLWLMLLPALLFGVVTVLVPLELGQAGWGAAAIAAVFLTGAAAEVVLHPLIGRYSDRRGRFLPVRLALIASIAVSLGLAWADLAVVVAILAVLSLLAYGGFYAPASAMISDTAESFGLAQGLSFGLANGAWAGGNAVGPALGGQLADLFGDGLPFLLSAVVCTVTLVAVSVLRGSGTLDRRVPRTS